MDPDEETEDTVEPLSDNLLPPPPDMPDPGEPTVIDPPAGAEPGEPEEYPERPPPPLADDE